ncbi:MAG: prolyl oligopeptidase family serine peptidase [Actinomycetota bacterium]|nr:prolyl oligopeptidase family serine peptidase [Actinomycetota bacterium]
MIERNVRFTSQRESEDISLEGVLSIPEKTDVVAGVILCHPHPMGGGNMYVPLFECLVREVCARGFAALRFNFGGVGNSDGVFTNGAEETDDVLSGLTYLGSLLNLDDERMAIVGWSFGSQVAVSAMEKGACASCLIAIGLPLVACDPEKLKESLSVIGAKTTLIVGENDALCPLGELKSILGDSSDDGDRIVVIQNTDHFLIGKEEEISKKVTQLLQRCFSLPAQ